MTHSPGDAQKRHLVRRYVLLLGSNVDRERMLPAARDLLAAALDIERCSPVYESPAIDAPGTPSFYNQALIVRCTLEVGALRPRLRAIESALGRRRGRDSNAPRTMDIDVVLALGPDDEILPDPVPDPLLARHHHIHRPVADLIGHARWPATQQSIRELRLPTPAPELRRV